jgi:hypothetical protein
MNERPHGTPVDEADELEPGFGMDVVFAVGLGLVIAGIGTFTAMTVALLWSALS